MSDWYAKHTKKDLADRIEELERAIDERDAVIAAHLALADQAHAELQAEKALADRLERELTDAKLTATAQYKGNLYPESADGWEMCVNDMLGSIEDGLAAYRKARGM